MSTSHSSVNTLQIKIGEIWNKGEGQSLKFDIDAPLQIEHGDFSVNSHVKADMHLIKLKNEISVIAENITIQLKTHCQRCLKPLIQDIVIKNAEREFLSKKPQKSEHLADIMDIFLVDLERMTIDLSDMLSQEIILHFPLFTVCSKSCKGMCQRCGADLNKTDQNNKGCGHPQEPDPKEIENHPFKNLKNLIQ